MPFNVVLYLSAENIYKSSNDNIGSPSVAILSYTVKPWKFCIRTIKQFSRIKDFILNT